MCGIFAYTGSRGKEASTVLLDGLQSLEYRGYDSAGIYIPEQGVIKTKGAVGALRAKVPKSFTGKSGIAHLRWATHGVPNEANAHPHQGGKGDIWLVHNGIIENFRELKEKLMAKGHTFLSESDTEVLAHLIEEHLKRENHFEKAVLKALNEVRGTYGLAIQYAKEPETLIAARMGSPIVLGVGDGEHFIASDASPILKHTKKVLFLNDGEMAVLKPKSHAVYKLSHKRVHRAPEELAWDAEEAQKGGFEHFMMKEIMEAPEVVLNTMRGRLIPKKGMAKLGGLEGVAKKLEKIERIIIVGCGTAYYAGLIGEYMLEEFAGIPVEVELASEFRYRAPVLNQRTALIAVSELKEKIGG